MFEEVHGNRSTDGERITVYRHEETGEIFSKIVGGVVWPGTRDGFVIVLGEKAEPPRIGGRRSVTLFHEAYVKSMVELTRECAALEGLSHVREWWAQIEGDNEGYEARFYELARELGARLNACQWSLPENFGLALQVLRQRFQENGLLLLKDGILEELLVSVNGEDPGQKDLSTKYPEIMVLAACVYELDMNSTGEEEDPDAWRDEVPPECLGRSRIGGY
jgi:hypothetical protein